MTILSIHKNACWKRPPRPKYTERPLILELILTFDRTKRLNFCSEIYNH